MIFVTVDGRVYRVMNVTIAAPGGTVVIYELSLDIKKFAEKVEQNINDVRRGVALDIF